MRDIAKGLINPAGREYLQREFKTTDQDVAALIASGSDRSGPPGGGTPSRGPPRGRGTPSSRGPPSNKGPPGGGGGGGGGGEVGGEGGGAGGGGGGDLQSPSPPLPSPSPTPPGSSGSGGSRRRRDGGRRMNQTKLRRQMDLLAEDARPRTEGRNIEKVTHTNMVTTVYADGGPPISVRTSSRISNP